MAPLSGLPSLKVSEMWNLLGWPNAAEHMDLRQGLLAEVKRILSRGGWRTHLDLSDEDFKDVLQTIFLLPQLPYRFQRALFSAWPVERVMNHDELLALMAPESPYARARDARKVVYGLISMAFSEMDDEQSKQHPQPAYTPRAPEPRENIVRDVIFWNIDPDNLNVPPPFLNTTNSLIDVIKECSVIIDEHSNFRVSIGYYTAPVTIQSTGLRIDSFLLAWRRAVEFLSNENDIPLDAVFPFPRFISASINGDFAREDRADPEETKLWRWPESAGWKSAFFEKRYGGEWTDVVAREISHTGSLQDWFLEMSSNTEPGRSLAVVRCILHSAETTEEVTDGLPFLTSVEFESFRNPFLPIKSNGGTIRGT